ncbi:hypothetical protein AK812_SmicGene45265, partial [Symbiodinium microadriaticum]
MSEDIGEESKSSDHSILDSEQEVCEDWFDDWDWVDAEMQCDAEEDVRDRREWSREMEMQKDFNKRLANMTVRYFNMQGDEIHSSRPYLPLCQIEQCGSFREAWLAQLHEGNNPDRCLSLQQLRVKRQETNKPIPPETLQCRSARDVLLHDLDSSPAGPIPLESTQLVSDGDVITDAWSWRELMDRSSFNKDVMDLQAVARKKKKALEPKGGRQEEEESTRAQRRELQAERAEEGAGTRGPRPIATEAEQRGYPFPDEEALNPEQIEERYVAFTRSWARFGLSRLCAACCTLAPAKHCRKATATTEMLCRNCREKNTKFLLPVLPPIPEALQQLQPIEQHLIAMARISQVLLDKLPAGGPSAQWGRMYAVLVDDPFICDVLDGATLEEDGTVLVEGVQGQIASPARLDCLHKALQELKAQHRLYKANPAVDGALARMEAILAGTRPSGSAVACTNEATSQGRQTGESGGSHSSALGGGACTPEKTEAPEQEGTLEMTYLIPKELKAPRPQNTDLQKARSIAALSDDMDVKFFPHLFPAGTGGWQNGYGSMSQYARKRLLGLDPRFEASPAYIMWLLEMHIKKRLSGNINVRIGGQPPSGKSKYQEGRGQVFTALRDIPGTSSYVFAKKGVALNMYEQLGTPKFFMTLSTHARQPDILIAVVVARLLRLRSANAPQELEREAAQILQCYQADKKFTWDGLSPNRLCNQYPAIVARQFMHQLTQLMHWLSGGQGAASRMEDEADAQDQPEDTLEEDFIQAPAADSAGQHRGVRKEDPPFRVVDYLIRIEWQKRGYPHAHILLWVVEWENKKKPDHKTKPAHEDKEAEAEAQVPDWSDDEAMKQFTPTCAEDWSDKYITTKGPLSWRQSTKVSARDKELNAQLAELLVHKHTEYCGIKTHGACRFGFPHRPEPRTRRRSSQEKYANSRWKSSLATRRAECDKGMGQYNIKILRRWRASMDLQ